MLRIPIMYLFFAYQQINQKSVTMDMALDLMRQSAFTVENNQLIFTGKVDFPLHGPGGVNFEGRIAVLADNGEVKMDERVSV